MDALQAVVRKHEELTKKLWQLPREPLCMGVNYEGDVEETDEDVHDGYGKEEEVMRSVEIWTFLDDQAEEKVAAQRNANNGEVEYDVGPAEIGHQSQTELIKVSSFTLAGLSRRGHNSSLSHRHRNRHHTGFPHIPGCTESLD